MQGVAYCLYICLFYRIVARLHSYSDCLSVDSVRDVSVSQCILVNSRCRRLRPGGDWGRSRDGVLDRGPRGWRRALPKLLWGGLVSCRFCAKKTYFRLVLCRPVGSSACPDDATGTPLARRDACKDGRSYRDCVSVCVCMVWTVVCREDV